MTVGILKGKTGRKFAELTQFSSGKGQAVLDALERVPELKGLSCDKISQLDGTPGAMDSYMADIIKRRLPPNGGGIRIPEKELVLAMIANENSLERNELSGEQKQALDKEVQDAMEKGKDHPVYGDKMNRLRTAMAGLRQTSRNEESHKVGSAIATIRDFCPAR